MAPMATLELAREAIEMPQSTLQLRAEEVWTALDMIDPVVIMAEELIGNVIERPKRSQTPGRLTRPTGPHNGTGDLILLEHPQVRCWLPARSLQMSQNAAVAAITARELLVPGGVTVAMLGMDATTQPQVGVIARHVPDISHVALCGTRGNPPGRLDAKLTDQLELSGIGLSVMDTAAEALFGANLVIAADASLLRDEPANLQVTQLVRGAVLVNSTGEDLPAELVGRVDQIYVDDLGLLEAGRDRSVVAAHLARSDERADGRGEQEGPRIVADLGRLLAGAHAGRQRIDDILLVELLGSDVPNAQLAYKIVRAAQKIGLGTQVEG